VGRAARWAAPAARRGTAAAAPPHPGRGRRRRRRRVRAGRPSACRARSAHAFCGGHVCSPHRAARAPPQRGARAPPVHDADLARARRLAAVRPGGRSCGRGAGSACRGDAEAQAVQAQPGVERGWPQSGRRAFALGAAPHRRALQRQFTHAQHHARAPDALALVTAGTRRTAPAAGPPRCGHGGVAAQVVIPYPNPAVRRVERERQQHIAQVYRKVGGERGSGARGEAACTAVDANVTVAALRVDLAGGASGAGLAPCPDPGRVLASEQAPHGGAAGARRAGGGAAGARGGGWLGARGRRRLMQSPADAEDGEKSAGTGAEAAPPPDFLAVAWRSSGGARHPGGPSWRRAPARAGPGSVCREPSPRLPPLPDEVRIAVAPVAARLAAADVARLVGFWQALEGVMAGAAALAHAAGQPPMRSAVARAAGCSGRRRLLSEPDAAPLQAQAGNPLFALYHHSFCAAQRDGLSPLPHIRKEVMVQCNMASLHA